jgi:PmbA protein
VAVLEKDEMIRLAETAMEKSLKKGAQEAEAYVYEGQATNVGIELGQISKSNRIIDRGLGIRVTVNKAIGFAYTNILEGEKATEDVISRALNAAKASKPDPEWKGLPEKKSYQTAEITYDNRLLELRAEDLVEIASRMLDAAASANKYVVPVEGGAGAAYLSNAIANSNGIAIFDRGTSIECSLAAVAKYGSNVTPVCFEFTAERNYNVDPEWVGKETGRLAASALKTKRIETKKAKIIFTQFALQELLYYTLINAVKADSVQRSQSPFKDKTGERVASENITIDDDGLMPGGLRSSSFDGEGAPHQKTSLIDKGILRNFLYDNYTAKKEGKQSTGNASRAGYLSTPEIEASNFHIKPGTTSAEEIISETKDGLIIYYLQGAHSSNPVSGEFSVVATPAWEINKGEIGRSTRGVMLAGNIFELLKNVSIIGNNERKMGQLVSPWILVENVRVIGNKLIAE